MAKKASPTKTSNLGQELIAGLHEVREWVAGRQSPVKATQIVDPSSKRVARISLPGGGSVTISVPLEPDPHAADRLIGRIRKAVRQVVKEN